MKHSNDIHRRDAELPESGWNEVTRRIIKGAIEVHRALGPGLLESTYEACLAKELSLGGLVFKRQEYVPVTYKGTLLDCGYRIDLLVESRVIVELKSVEKILPIHRAQLLTYLRHTGLSVGLLINFNVPVLMDGVVRQVNCT